MFERVAGEMACVHNMIVRGLNSIYLQAPHIPLPEVPAFIQYSLIWYKLMHLHHSCEESDFFQTISGETGIMSGNVEQHHAFQEELVTFYLYLKECANDPTQFSGNRILSSIDSFGRVWCNTLPRRFQRSLVYKGLASRRWGNWRPDFLKTARRTWFVCLLRYCRHPRLKCLKQEEMGLVAGLPWCFSNHDIAFEEGNWSKWPPAPGVVKFICRSVDFWLHRDWWKFAACDRHGRQRPLRFVPRPKPAG